jgi:hypothetical protein
LPEKTFAININEAFKNGGTPRGKLFYITFILGF